MSAVKIGKVLLSTVTASTPLRPSAMSGTVVVPKRNALKQMVKVRSKQYYCIVVEDRKVRVQEKREQ